MTMRQLETERLRVQAEIDFARAPGERNKLGQFATPPKLAVEILAHAKRFLKKEHSVKFLDPAVGTGSFYSALLETFAADRISEARGYEIDPAFAKAAKTLWAASGLKVIANDFTVQVPTPDFNLVISNPPYVRHHHLTMECKSRLRNAAHQELGLEVSGLTGLYCYFMLLCHHWMTDDGVAGWLIPSEFMDVNYGSAIKRYLLQHVELLQIHRFDPTEAQFEDALVSSAIVWFRKRIPSKNHKVKFTYGGTLDAPKIERPIAVNMLTCTAKWTRYPKEDVTTLNSGGTRLGDLLSIRRGLATGNNRFFIFTKERIKELGLPTACFRPILPPPRQLKETEVFADDNGCPLLDEQSFLLDIDLPLKEVEKRYSKLAMYLKSGDATSKGYLCAHRDPWYSQERRDAAPLLCTYMGRGTSATQSPFRFILNHSKATATNVYLMLYPKPDLEKRLKADSGLLKRIWEKLNGIPQEVLLGEGRVYGGGLYKLEPRELANVPLNI